MLSISNKKLCNAETGGQTSTCTDTGLIVSDCSYGIGHNKTESF